MASWKKISSKTVYRCPYFELTKDEVVNPFGKKGVYHVIKESGAVAVVPLDKENNIYLIHEEKYIPGLIWTIPAGRLNDENEPPLLAAKRELKEEAGFLAKRLEKLGEFYLTPGYSTEYMYLFKAEVLKKEKRKTEKGEVIKKVKAFSLKEISEMIRKKEIVDAKTVLAVYLLTENKR